MNQNSLMNTFFNVFGTPHEIVVHAPVVAYQARMDLNKISRGLSVMTFHLNLFCHCVSDILIYEHS